MERRHDTAPPAGTDDHDDHEALLGHLVASHLAGSVQTSARSSLENCRRLVAGDPDYTFGLSDWRTADFAEAVAALRAAGGSRLEVSEADLSGRGFIDPEATLAGIRAQREGIARFLAAGGGRVLLATGHPFALLAHYGAVGRALVTAGCSLVRPLEGERNRLHTPEGQPCAVRYSDGVAALSYAGGLHHTHRPDYMEAMLEAVGGRGGVDLVLADHGFAGAALEAGIPTLSIADVNDPALPLAQARGRTDEVLLIDDGLEPSVFAPVTRAILGGVPQ